MKRPNVFLVGAPKCGTTSLMSWLAQHPDVYTSPTKEPHYFYSPYGCTCSADKYEALFSGAKPEHKAVVEGSVWYLYSRRAIDKILAYNREAKFIVCLRNPLEMLPSLHAQKIFTGHEGIRDLEEAWRLSDARTKGEFTGIVNLGSYADAGHMAYKEACALGGQVRDLVRKVPAARIHCVFIDDISKDAAGAFRDLCEFLGVWADAPIRFEAQNRAKSWRSPKLRALLRALSRARRAVGLRSTGTLKGLRNANISDERYSEMRPEFRQEVLEFFADDIRLLGQVTGRDVSAWLQ